MQVAEGAGAGALASVEAGNECGQRENGLEFHPSRAAAGAVGRGLLLGDQALEPQAEDELPHRGAVRLAPRPLQRLGESHHGEARGLGLQQRPAPEVGHEAQIVAIVVEQVEDHERGGHRRHHAGAGAGGLSVTAVSPVECRQSVLEADDLAVEHDAAADVGLGQRFHQLRIAIGDVHLVAIDQLHNVVRHVSKAANPIPLNLPQIQVCPTQGRDCVAHERGDRPALRSKHD